MSTSDKILLIVEPAAERAQAIQRLLESHGYRVTVTAGPVAAAGASAQTPVLVVCDDAAAHTTSETPRQARELLEAQVELTRLNEKLQDQATQLRQNEERYRAVVEQIAEGIYLVDADTKCVIECNPSFRALLGYTLEEAMGMSVYQFVGHERENIDARFRQVLLANGHSLGERQYRRKDGTVIDVEVSAGVITYGGRKVVCSVVHDISLRKRAEEQLRIKNQQLEASARSEHEAHEALKRAQSHLVQSEKLASLGQLVAGIAHEVNNPLAFVTNNMVVLQRDIGALCELLKLYREAESALGYRPDLLGRIRKLADRVDMTYILGNLDDLLARSRDGLQRIQQIVSGLRDFARLDKSDLSDVDFNAGIQSTLSIIRTKARAKEVTIDLQLGDLPLLTCYPAKINQVVMNLVDNAIDACSKGGTVTVRTYADEREIVLVVSDTGRGIDPDVRERIFDPFFTTKPPGQGTGLGLSISYGIIEEHRGTIEVESTPGTGSRFTVRLPNRSLR